MIDLKEDLKKKLLTFYQKKQYSEFENLVESLGKINELPLFLQIGYAGSKVLNPNSKKKDYLISNSILNEAYKKDKSNLEVLHNFILSSLKAEEFYQILPLLNERIKQSPKDKKTLEGIARIHFFLGNMDICIRYFKKLLDLTPDNEIDGGRFQYIASMNYPSGLTQNDYLSECLKLNELINKNLKKKKFIKLNSNKNSDKVKLGFVSGDFRSHSVGLFLEKFIDKIDKKNFHLTGFSNLEISRQDNLTKYFKECFDEWQDTFDLTDDQMIENIRNQDIDILIDLIGLTYGHRIKVFATRCAPVQICWLGYNNSIGIDNMDYIIADPNLIYENEKNQYTEKILYMPKIWNCMGRPNNLPDIEETPCLKSEIFSFGSFNNFQKISNDTIKIWSEILKNSNSQIYLKHSYGYSKEVYNVIKNKFLNEGVNLNKIIFLEKKKTTEEHLKDYNKVDLALDTFPYTGVTTSFESYTMGVPVLTLEGFNLNSRCGVSINKNLSLDEFIAKNHSDYIKKAIFFTKNRFALKTIIGNLRQQVLDSPLFDIDDFVHNFSKVMKKLYKK